MAECTILEKLQYINETKDLIRAAIEAQDVEVLDSDTFRKYAEYVASIRKVSSVNGQQGDIVLKTINGEDLVGEGNIELVVDLSDYYNKEEVDAKIPTDYIKSEDLEKYVTEDELNEKGYLTSIPDTYVTDEELSTATSDKVSQTALNEAIEGVNNKIPTKVSELDNDSGFITKNDVVVEETDPIFDKWKNEDNVIVGNGASYDTDGASEEEIQPSIIIGKGANVWASGIAIGENAYSELGAVTIGKNITSYGIVSIGSDNEGSGIAIGKNNKGGGIVIGENNNGNGITIGSGVTENYGGIAIGNNISNPTDTGIAIGLNAKINTKNPDDTDNGYGIAIGVASIAYDKNDVAIGRRVETDATYTTNFNNLIKGDASSNVYILKDNVWVKLQDYLNGGGSVNVIELTQSEYDNLVTYEEGTIYVITDASEIAIPTKVSELDNDKGYITKDEVPSTDLSDYYTKTELDEHLDWDKLYWNSFQYSNDDGNWISLRNKTSLRGNIIYFKTINGENTVGQGDITFKTINGESLIGSGDITVQGGSADLSNYYTKSEIDSLIGNVETKISEINDLI